MEGVHLVVGLGGGLEFPGLRPKEKLLERNKLKKFIFFLKKFGHNKFPKFFNPNQLCL